MEKKKEQNPIKVEIPKEKKDQNINPSPNSFKEKADAEIQHLLNSPMNPNNNNNQNIFVFNGNNKEKTITKSSKPEQEVFNINRKGNMKMFFYNKKGDPLIVIGPNWQLAFIMLISIDISSICYFYFFWNMLFKFLRYLGIIIFLIQSTIYLITILINPGIPSKDLWLENYKHLDEIGTYRICNICKIIMKNEDKTDHCDECNICIIGADHHCPWTSKCVGANNKNMFYIFVFSTFTLLIYFICGAFLTIVFIDDDRK